MVAERTLSIIKPDAVASNRIGGILARFEKNGLTVAGLKMLTLSRQQIEQVYGMHEGQPYYPDLLQFMSSGPSVAVVLEGENAIEKNRAIMGHTNPALAGPGTIRADFGTATNRNAVHGSDGPRTARAEIASLFGPEDLGGSSANSEPRYQSARA